MKPVSTIVVVVFALVAVVHLMRIIQGWEVIVNGITMPLWVSVVGAIIAGGLAILLWREGRGYVTIHSDKRKAHRLGTK